jgi:site-specific recombinase XerD
MNQLAAVPSRNLPVVPELIARAGDRASMRFLEFFAATIRNPHTRRAYSRAVSEFLTWCTENGVPSIAAVQPLHVATWIELQTRRVSAPTVKQRLAAIRHLFDWLVVCQIVAVNPASPVRGPTHSVNKGKTKVLSAQEARLLLDTIDASTVVGLRDRALIAVMVYSFARIGAAIQMQVKDVFVEKRRTWIRLHEKGGKEHVMPCNQQLDVYLHAYINGTGLDKTPEAFLFPTADWLTGELFETPMRQADAYRMVRRRAGRAGILTEIGNHSFRATGITEYLRNGGKLEVAQKMANHESSRTTGLYDRRADDVSIEEVEKIVI